MKNRAIHAPMPIHWALQDTIDIVKGGCFFNCGLAVLYAVGESEYSTKLAEQNWKVSYVLGLLSPPEQNPVPHAWLLAKNDTLELAWDPTLQQNSPLWGMRNQEFFYDAEKVLSAEDLKLWLSQKYTGRKFDSYGFPDKEFQFPTIDQSRNITFPFR